MPAAVELPPPPRPLLSGAGGSVGEGKRLICAANGRGGGRGVAAVHRGWEERRGSRHRVPSSLRTERRRGQGSPPSAAMGTEGEDKISGGSWGGAGILLRRSSFRGEAREKKLIVGPISNNAHCGDECLIYLFSYVDALDFS